LFITFEGMEGCGKTTQVERLAKTLASRGIPVIRTFEPGGTPCGDKIRRILLDRANRDLDPMAELCLYEADRAQHVAQVIRPALERGIWVICDRFFDATVVYQGMARGQDLELIRALNSKVTGGIRPDLTVLLDCPVGQGLKRAFQRNRSLGTRGEASQDRFEREAAAFHEAVRRGYLELARLEPDRFVIIDASPGPDEVESIVLQALGPLLPG
jgi:dTMP kinase